MNYPGSRQSNNIYLNKNTEYIFNNKRKDNKGNKDNENNLIKTKSKIYYIQKKLFPYKYYLCSIFIKNINLNKKSNFFTEKFIFVYNFICQLFDISSYLILQREFQIIKNTIMMGKYNNILENIQKINVNDNSFKNDILQSLDDKNFYILGRINKSRDIE